MSTNIGRQTVRKLALWYVRRSRARSMHSSGNSYAEIGRKLRISRARAHQLVKGQARKVHG